VTVIVGSFFESVVRDHSKDHAVTVTHSAATRSPGPVHHSAGLHYPEPREPPRNVRRLPSLGRLAPCRGARASGARPSWRPGRNQQQGPGRWPGPVPM